MGVEKRTAEIGRGGHGGTKLRETDGARGSPEIKTLHEKFVSTATTVRGKVKIPCFVIEMSHLLLLQKGFFPTFNIKQY